MKLLRESELFNIWIPSNSEISLITCGSIGKYNERVKQRKSFKIDNKFILLNDENYYNPVCYSFI